ncbi:MAG: flagellar biosynthesis protein FlhF [Gammaproteobacteria bacterium]|nr:flagellar biosynthesis protein FlhF [Gammaproteobacteria bacterium]
MKIRRFFATDMRKALKEVSEELGPDAAIMSTRKTKGGVEVVAATDYDTALEQHNQSVKTQKKHAVSVKTESNVEPITNRQPTIQQPSFDVEWSQEPNMVAIKEEVRLMRELLQDQLGELAWNDKSRRAPIQAALLRKMVKMGFPPHLSNTFAKTIQIGNDFESAWSQLINNLCAAMPKVEHNILDKGGIVSLVGPTGVGKTTTIAKLAARYVLEHGAENIALVTTDSYRVAAHEQLRTYANIMGVSMRVAHDSESLSVILNELSEKQLILIDTAGISQRDKRLAEQMSCLMNSGKSIDSYLVLSATAQTKVLKDASKTFNLLPLAGTILTKLDEAVSLGESLGVVIAENLKIAYVTDGQRVPEDLHDADPVKLINKAVNLGQTETEDWVTAMTLNQG